MGRSFGGIAAHQAEGKAIAFSISVLNLAPNFAASLLSSTE
jgi:hypothetical protein